VASKRSACIHRVLEGNIHEFVLTEASRQGVDELFDTVENIMADAHAKNDMSVIAGRFLLDSSVGVLPLNQAFTRARAIASKFPSHPQSRTALVFAASPLVRTIDLVLRTFVSVRFYGSNERDQALAWLRENAPTAAKR
jgi:hypothetical protein